MFSMKLFEEAGAGSGSIWIPILFLGWFLLMTVVGWLVSQRNLPAEGELQPTGISLPDNNPSEFDDQ